MMEEIDRFQVPTVHAEMQPLDPAAAAITDADCDTREGETVAMNYKPSPLQVKLDKGTELNASRCVLGDNGLNLKTALGNLSWFAAI